MTERVLPSLMRELHKLEFDYADGAGYDFEPYEELLSESETRSWMQAWTGNPDADGLEFWVFGQDGTGGYAAFWLARPDVSLVEQPIVFLGSEGSVGVVARNLAEYLWVLAGGIGPCEAVESPEKSAAPEHASKPFLRFAEAHAPSARRGPREIIEAAQREFPDFQSHVDSLCR